MGFSKNERNPKIVSDFRLAKTFIAIGLLASWTHFVDNAIEITSYPEPGWITPFGIWVGLLVVVTIALVALLRKKPDPLFFLAARTDALLLLSGLLHFVFGSPTQMPIRSNITVLAEAIVGAALAATLLRTIRISKR
jgi:hypothetical protein